ncbi:MAPEG family protein [Simplicispira psychrophila]|uniref:MAPEG family protein n=1 Tax=Simplicispira psychrophila TaxID=80882 RepID=UPI0004868C67|nr:MAPEG family protein [Simplicispira psychrophila]
MAHFTIAYGTILVAALLPIVCAGLAKRGGFGQSPKDGGYDNHNPRAWLAHQDERSARANAAQANSFEALPFFIGAVIMAHQLGASQTLLDGLAVAFIALRVVYIALYVADRAAARSMVWAVALLLNIAIFFIGFR